MVDRRHSEARTCFTTSYYAALISRLHVCPATASRLHSDSYAYMKANALPSILGTGHAESESAGLTLCCLCTNSLFLLARSVDLICLAHAHAGKCHVRCTCTYKARNMSRNVHTCCCLGISNKSVTVHRQDSIRPCRPHAVLSVHCNIYVRVFPTLYEW